MKETRKVDPKYYKGDHRFLPKMSEEEEQDWNELIFKIVDDLIKWVKEVDNETVTEEKVLTDFNSEFSQYLADLYPNYDELDDDDGHYVGRTEYYDLNSYCFGLRRNVDPNEYFAAVDVDITPWDIFPAEKRMVERYISKY